MVWADRQLWPNLSLEREMIKNLDRLILKNLEKREISGQINLNQLAVAVCNSHWKYHVFLITLLKYSVRSEKIILLTSRKGLL